MNLDEKDIKNLEEVTNILDAWQDDCMVMDCLHISDEVEFLKYIVAKLKTKEFKS
jgi:hypothetical protein